jgi:hypothetical protein
MTVEDITTREGMSQDGETTAVESMIAAGGSAGYSSSSSDGCYIATATLVSGGSENQLDILRQWRDEVMRVTQIGRSLEAFYHRTGPTVAHRVKGNSALAASFLYPFVRPSVWLAQRRAKSRVFKSVYDVTLYAVFLSGLAYGTVVYLVCHKSK